MNTIISATGLSKIYTRGAEQIKAVNNVDLEIQSGEFVAFMGASGSGKTTLIHLLGCLDTPSTGTLTIAGKEVFAAEKSLSEKKLTKVRAELFGYIFQKFYLIPTLTVKENIMLPFAFYKKPGLHQDAVTMARRLGLEHRLNHLPKEISGGEMQRVAIARALINKPRILLADEPTGNLDTKRSDEITEILHDLNRGEKLTIILVTHNPLLASHASRKLELRDGQLISE
ncbi:MAG: hypothetical protein CVU48_07525 [Candidatus Cloacimonetes bacterium HGW-Cloacimonetes-1]|jgi:ABC-type lipoprotein export system ATPase subunit|nr:MAG: hypothetical protein CVU48_07525 [Candidatus Cloacimonetes bacterium HGW-Cloacimonetes-1]